jgi:membrane-bound serine protease (ClpP class)
MRCLPGQNGHVTRARFAALVLGLALAPRAAPAGPGPAPRVVVIPLTGMIHAASAELVIGAIGTANESGAALIVLEINTPGGYMSSMEEIQNAILASPVPVAALVAPAGASAASAGFFILMTADVAAMAPGTTTGSAHPVFAGGGEAEQKGETIPEKKMEHHAAARMRTVVERRERNVAEAEKAVRESVSFTDQEAIACNLIEHVVPDVAALLAAIEGQGIRRFDGREETLDLRGAVVERVELDLRQRVLALIALPQVAYLLFLLGALGIWVELTHPGFVAPGVIGALAMLLALYATTVLPVNVTGVLLLALGFVLFVLEVKFTSYGVLGVGGVLALVIGSLMLFDGPMPGVELRLSAVLPASLAAAAIVLALAAAVLRTRGAPAVAGVGTLVGVRGTALSEVGTGQGQVFIYGEYWSARSAATIPSGSPVRVVAVRGLQLEVEPASEGPLPAAG